MGDAGSGVSSPGVSGARLRVWQGGQWVGEWPLVPGHTLRIGRGQRCDVVIHDPLASRAHLEVRPVDGGWEAVDLGSTHGTRCNGVRIERHRLRSGDQLALGDSIVLALDVEEPQPAPPPPPPVAGGGAWFTAPPQAAAGSAATAPSQLPPAAGAGPPVAVSRAPARTGCGCGRLALVAAVVLLLAAGLAAVGGWLLWPRLRGSEPWSRWFGGERGAPTTGFSRDAARVGPAGGAIERGGARLQIPPGALARSELVDFLPAGEVPTLTYQPAGPAFALRSEQAWFAKPLLVTLPIDRSRLPAGTKAEQVYAVLAQGGLGERLEGAKVDLSAGTLTVALDHATPLVAAQGTAGPSPPGPGTPAAAAPPVVQAAAGPAFGVVLMTPQAIYGAPMNLPGREQMVEEVRQVLHVARAQYRDIEIDPGQLLVEIVPMNARINAFVSGRYRLSVNPDFWAAYTEMARIDTLVHEYFHLVQNRFVARNLGRTGASVPSDFRARGQADWLWEATATWMETHLVPSAGARQLGRLTRNFCYLPLNQFDEVSTKPGDVNPENPHQYSAFVFFSYLDTLYPGRHVVLNVWSDYLSGNWVADTVENDALRGRGTFNPLTVLDRYLQATPDNRGRRRNLREVYADFLLHYNWTKDFPPIAGGVHNKELGDARELVLPGRIVPWTLPFDDGGKLRLQRTETASGGPFDIVRAYHITNQLDAKGQRGDLEVRLGIQRIAPAEESLLVVFPYKRGTEAPLLGNSQNPVKLENWQDYIGAVVWTVDLSLNGNWNLTTIAELKRSRQPEAATTTPKLGPEVCQLVERKETRWEDMESGTWQVTPKPTSVDLLNVDSSRTIVVAFTQPAGTLRKGQEVPFEVSCTAPPGFNEQGSMSNLWQTTQAYGEMELLGFDRSPPACQADNSHPGQQQRAVARFSGPGSGDPPGPRELVKLKVKAVAGNASYYLFLGWWYDCH